MTSDDARACRPALYNVLSMVAYRTAPDPEETGWPKGIPYIIGNEGCERFSFYGMRAILFVYISFLLRNSGVTDALSERHATEVVHTFFAGVYACPWSVRSSPTAGGASTHHHLALARVLRGPRVPGPVRRKSKGSIVGLVLIAVGSGGIKPCVSSHVGDQFGRGNFRKVERVYQAFYFIINFGSFFSTLLIPWVKGTGASGWPLPSRAS